MSDIQNRSDMDHMARLIIDKSPVILFRRRAGDDPELVYVSPNVRRFGYTAEAFLAGEIHFRDIVHPDDLERVGAEIMFYTENSVETYTQIYRIVTRDGDVRWVEDQTSVTRDPDTGDTFNQGVVVDITRRKLAEDELKKSEEKYRRIVETAAEGFLLMDCGLKIVDVNDAYCRMLGYERDELIGKTPLDLATDAFRQYMTANRESILSMEHRRLEGEVHAKDGRVVPVLIQGNTLRTDDGEIIGNVAFVTDMTSHKKALALAGEVQKSLLPRRGPQVDGLDIAGRNQSCDEIGGDYFDFIWKKETREHPLNVVVGDITGHGVDSALLMTSARAFLRMRASQPGSIADIMDAMNRQLFRDVQDSGRFMTLFYLTVDPSRGTIEWVRAGHDPGLVYDPGADTFTELKGPGMALGVDDTFRYRVNRKRGLSHGQIIALGTDGIWESHDRNGNMFGKERFKTLIRSHAHLGAAEILDAVFDALDGFARGVKREDDITLVIVKFTRPHGREDAGI